MGFIGLRQCLAGCQFCIYGSDVCRYACSVQEPVNSRCSICAVRLGGGHDVMVHALGAACMIKRCGDGGTKPSWPGSRCVLI